MTGQQVPMVDRAAFAALLRSARRSHGWSVDELARRSTLSATTIARLEGEIWDARLSTIVLLAEPLEMTADTFAHAYCGTIARNLRAVRSPDIPPAAQTTAGAGAERLATAARAARTAVGISASLLVHVPPSTVGLLERGERRAPRATTVYAFAASIASQRTLQVRLFRALVRVYAGEDPTLDPALLGRLQLRRAR